MACQTCEGCNRCNYCQSCEAQCERCETSCNATTGCITQQNFCSKNQNVNMNFSWNSTIDKDATISITASSFNSLVDKISSAYARGNQSNGGASSAKAVNKNETISADKINNLASALWGLGGTSGTQISVKAGDLITASIFQNLATAANDLKYKSSQCDTCNIQCDITCNKCQTGNKCAGGNICVSGNTAFSCCQYTP